jgi:hypothetical protein
MGNIQNPLLRCCGPDRTPEASNLAFNKVELAASELFNLTVATAYHTSVLVNGEEFFFSDSGIFSDRALNSHEGKPSERTMLGYSEKTGAQLLRVLQQHFRPGTYDLVRKNCNSFSDCAIYYLLGMRLERRYCALEKLGMSNLEMLSQLTKGMYKPNTAAEDFQVEMVLTALDQASGESAQTGNDAAEGVKSRPALLPGNKVTIVGLTAATRLNGQGATVARYNAINGRWEVVLHISGERKGMRAEHLRAVGELVLEPGDRVRVLGLKSESGQELNGKEGQVVRYMHEVSRYEICLDGTEAAKALKAENLQQLAA